MSALDLDALELLAKATPAPWREGTVERFHVFAPNTHPEAMGPERVLLRMNEHFPHVDDARLIAALRNAAPEMLAIARAVVAWGQARATQRVTQQAVDDAGAKHRDDRFNVVLREAWEQAGNANLRAHDGTSRRFSDLCRIADAAAVARVP